MVKVSGPWSEGIKQTTLDAVPTEDGGVIVLDVTVFVDEFQINSRMLNGICTRRRPTRQQQADGDAGT